MLFLACFVSTSENTLESKHNTVVGCSPEKNAEELAQVHVVWSLFKAQATAVVQIHGKLCWETLENMHCAVICHNCLESAIQIKYNSNATELHGDMENRLYHNLCVFTLQRTSTGVDIFFSEIFSYFCFFVAA